MGVRSHTSSDRSTADPLRANTPIPSASADDGYTRSMIAVRLFAKVSMMVFLAILVVGFAYEWMSGALEWE